MSEVESARQRLTEYAVDLGNRLEEQSAWWARHPQYSALHEIPDEVFGSDPYPDVRDSLSARRFHDILVVVLDASDRRDNE
jgi:hypothetical protein